jgi:hypothetical protein
MPPDRVFLHSRSITEGKVQQLGHHICRHAAQQRIQSSCTVGMMEQLCNHLTACRTVPVVSTKLHLAWLKLALVLHSLVPWGTILTPEKLTAEITASNPILCPTT